MNEFILSLIKYTVILTCTFYAYIKLLRIRPTVRDLFAVPVFIALSAILHYVTVYIKILVPIGLLIFSIVFLLLRFRKPVYETVTVGTIALSISLVTFVLSIILGYPIAIAFYFINNEILKNVLMQLSISTIQIICILFLFRIKRFRSGVDPKGNTATFEILLFFGVGCIFSMMLFYTKQPLYEIILLAISLCGLLLILWWRRHITYNYRETVKRRRVESLETELEEYKSDAAENELKVAVYDKIFHYLNKAVPDCASLAERAAMQTDCADAYAVRDILQRVLREMNVANEKCSFKSIPQTGVKVVDMPIIRLFTAAESRNLKVSTEIAANVGNWISERGLDKNDLHILLTYLCDNAAIAALGSPDAKVRVELSATDGAEPLIRIYDSGKQFDENVIAKLGKEQITTRADGNGIGLFTVFGILAKYKASFTLDETLMNFGFTKLIEIIFDGRDSFTVRTRRESVVAACAARKDITVEFSDAEILRDGTNG